MASKRFGFPLKSECPFCTLASKSNVTLLQALSLKILQSFLHGYLCRAIGAIIIMLENEMDGLTNTKQLLNLFCIVYYNIILCGLSFFVVLRVFFLFVL